MSKIRELQDKLDRAIKESEVKNNAEEISRLVQEISVEIRNAISQQNRAVKKIRGL